LNFHTKSNHTDPSIPNLFRIGSTSGVIGGLPTDGLFFAVELRSARHRPKRQHRAKLQFQGMSLWKM
jgi:hypothetical protein